MSISEHDGVRWRGDWQHEGEGSGDGAGHHEVQGVHSYTLPLQAEQWKCYIVQTVFKQSKLYLQGSDNLHNIKLCYWAVIFGLTNTPESPPPPSSQPLFSLSLLAVRNCNLNSLIKLTKGWFTPCECVCICEFHFYTFCMQEAFASIIIANG